VQYRTLAMIACRFCGDAANATVMSTGMETYTANLNTWLAHGRCVPANETWLWVLLEGTAQPQRSCSGRRPRLQSLGHDVRRRELAAGARHGSCLRMCCVWGAAALLLAQ
jgi:hypothetical protein